MMLLYTVACLGVLVIIWGLFMFIGGGILTGRPLSLFVGTMNIMMGIILLADVVPDIHDAE